MVYMIIIVLLVINWWNHFPPLDRKTSSVGSKGFRFWRKTDKMTKNHPFEKDFVFDEKLTKWRKTTLVKKILTFEGIWRNLTKLPILNCKIVVFIILPWISTNFHQNVWKYLIFISFTRISKYINNILNMMAQVCII